MDFAVTPFVLTIILVILALLVLRFIIKTAITILKVGLIVLFGVGVYFLFTTFIG